MVEKSIEEIYEDKSKCEKHYKNKTEIEYYIDKFRENIGKDKYKLLAYKMDVEKKTELNFPTFWITTIALISSIFLGTLSYATTMVSEESKGNAVIIYIVIGCCALMLIVPWIYYTCVKNERDKYLPMLYALNEIETNWNCKKGNKK